MWDLIAIIRNEFVEATFTIVIIVGLVALIAWLLGDMIFENRSVGAYPGSEINFPPEPKNPVRETLKEMVGTGDSEVQPTDHPQRMEGQYPVISEVAENRPEVAIPAMRRMSSFEVLTVGSPVSVFNPVNSISPEDEVGVGYVTSMGSRRTRVKVVFGSLAGTRMRRSNHNLQLVSRERLRGIRARGGL